MVDIKECKTCGVEKSELDFHKDSGRKDGLDPRCKECQKAKRSRLQGGNKRNIGPSKRYKIPFQIGVYALKKEGKVVYIGHSDSVAARIDIHFGKTGKESVLHFEGNKLIRKRDYSWHILWHGDSMDDAYHQEKLLVQLHQPELNQLKYNNYEG